MRLKTRQVLSFLNGVKLIPKRETFGWGGLGGCLVVVVKRIRLSGVDMQ